MKPDLLILFISLLLVIVLYFLALVSHVNNVAK